MLPLASRYTGTLVSRLHYPVLSRVRWWAYVTPKIILAVMRVNILGLIVWSYMISTLARDLAKNLADGLNFFEICGPLVSERVFDERAVLCGV